MEADLSEEIQIVDIAKELQRQWEAQEAEQQIRASLFNLILYAHDTKQEMALKSYVDAIIEKFPCRVIFIKRDQEPSHNYLKVFVSNVATTKGGMTIACDQINIDVTDSQMMRVPYIIFPHLLADLPIYLLWGQKEEIILPHFQKLATRLIFDSQCCEDLQHFSQSLLELEKTEITDVNWVATWGWRNVLASVFDTEQKIEELRRAKVVRIYYQQSEVQAHFLQAWLASQLYWDPIVELIPLEPKSAGAIEKVEIDTNERQYEFVRKETLPQVEVHICTAEECAMPFSLPLVDTKKSSSFLRNLLYRSSGAHFRNTLARLAAS